MNMISDYYLTQSLISHFDCDSTGSGRCPKLRRVLRDSCKMQVGVQSTFLATFQDVNRSLERRYQKRQLLLPGGHPLPLSLVDHSIRQ